VRFEATTTRDARGAPIVLSAAECVTQVSEHLVSQPDFKPVGSRRDVCSQRLLWQTRGHIRYTGAIIHALKLSPVRSWQ
jgi:hypothetical protein